MAAIVVVTTACGSESAAETEPIVIRWLLGFGTGLEENQLEVEQARVDEFNRSHDDVQIEMVVREMFAGSPDWEELKSSENAPDLIGPIGEAATIVHADDWLTLTREDLGDFDYDAAALASAEVPGGYSGVPVGIFPSMLLVNRAIFERDSIPLPPDRFDTPYEGQPWDWNTLRTLAAELTHDVAGRHPGEAGFDPNKPDTYGFGPHLVIIPLFGQSWEQGNTDWSGPRAEPPAGVLEGWRWLHDMVFVDQSTPDLMENGSDYMHGGQPFNSGNLAMGLAYSWALSTTAESSAVRDKVSFAVPPSHNGVSQVPYHADHFKVLKTTEHPKEAIEAMQFILNSPDGEVIETWGAVPARMDLRASYVEKVQEMFPGSNFDEAFLDELVSHLSVPSPERGLPLVGADEESTQFERDLMAAEEPGSEAAINRFLTDLKTRRGP